MIPLRDTAEVLEQGSAADPYGGPDTEPSWDTPTATTVAANVQPRTGTELSRDRAQSIGNWVAFLYPDAVVTTLNRLRWNGRTFQIHAVMPWRDLRARDHHIELDLSIVSEG